MLSMGTPAKVLLLTSSYVNYVKKLRMWLNQKCHYVQWKTLKVIFIFNCLRLTVLIEKKINVYLIY